MLMQTRWVASWTSSSTLREYKGIAARITERPRPSCCARTCEGISPRAPFTDMSDGFSPAKRTRDRGRVGTQAHEIVGIGEVVAEHLLDDKPLIEAMPS